MGCITHIGREWLWLLGRRCALDDIWEVLGDWEPEGIRMPDVPMDQPCRMDAGDGFDHQHGQAGGVVNGDCGL